MAGTAAWCGPAFAGAGADYNQLFPTALEEVGGNGGNVFGLTECPTGEVLTGLDFWLMPNTTYGTEGRAVRGLCSAISPALKLSAGSTTAIVAGVGPWASEFYSRSCPAGQAMSGWKLHKSDRNRTITGIEIYCSAIGTTQAEAKVGTPAPYGGVAGTAADAPGQATTCPADQLAGGFSGKRGEAIDSLKMTCYRVRSQKLAVSFDVTPPPAAYDGFGLSLTDAAGTTVLHGAGKSNLAEAILTRGNYVYQVVKPGNYRVSGTTCTTPVTLSPSVDNACRVGLAEIVSGTKSSIVVTTDRQRADGISADVLRIDLKGPDGIALADTRVTLALTWGVRFDGGAEGGVGYCTTDRSGSCSVRATSTAAGTYATLVMTDFKYLGSLSYTFVDPGVPRISGRIFEDTGSGLGIANDGVANGAEKGVPGATVALGDCGTKRHAGTVTDGSGRYALALPAGLAAGAALCVDAYRAGAGRISTGGSLAGTALPAGTAVDAAGTRYTYGHPTGTTDRIAFVLTAAQASAGQAGLDFGSVPPGRLAAPGLRDGRPGSAVLYPHVFTAGTAGRVAFSVDRSVATPALAGWDEQLFADPGCTGGLAAGAARILPTTVQAVGAGQVVCLVLRQAIPSQAAPGSVSEATLQAAFTLDNTVPALSASWRVDDTTTVSLETVELLKEVRNLSRGTATFGTVNQARSGDLLEYRITYTNTAARPVGRLVIHDSTPAFTRFVEAGSGAAPASLGACSKTTPASTTAVDCATAQPAGGGGALAWSYAGELSPGAVGTVLFRVLVD